MTLNKAIETVLRTQFKKQAKEAHKIVEESGYGIVKEGGYFTVYNEKTGRRIHLSDNGYRTYILHGSYSNKRKVIKTESDYQKFDYTGCLNKPVNKDYYQQINNERRNAYDPDSEAISKLKSAKWSLKYEEDRIARIQKEMEKLQKELISASMAKARAMEGLNKVREELGLRK